MGIEDLAGEAGKFLGSSEVQGALKSEQAEGISDDILDKVEDAVEGATGHKFDDQIKAARDAADGAVGDQ